MKNTDAYLFVLAVTLLLTAPIVHAIQTLLAMHARVIFPVLRMQTGQHYSTLITSPRSMEVIVCPRCASSFDHAIDSNPTTFTQPRRAL
ncbi:MAG: hypothetical protein AAB242_05565 [Nitrospirota bacterium]